ncbi:hypothetical protein [Streptomyces sp. NPDC007100]|uniref:hypothetical protein n=1 Tax=Streptomyces sp. NPDC007100 TaxID=3155602 RepID=UPI0033E072D2
MTSHLPSGWTIEQIRTLSQDRSATPLSLDRLVVVEEPDQGKGTRLGEPDQGTSTRLRPEVILGFHDLCLVLHDGEWFMGQLGTDGSITCWASYGPDLAGAIRGL